MRGRRSCRSSGRPRRRAERCGLTGWALLDRHASIRRRGRAAEGGGLLNRYTLQRRIEGSNPSVSANIIAYHRLRATRRLEGDAHAPAVVADRTGVAPRARSGCRLTGFGGPLTFPRRPRPRRRRRHRTNRTGGFGSRHRRTAAYPARVSVRCASQPLPGLALGQGQTRSRMIGAQPTGDLRGAEGASARPGMGTGSKPAS
jgi:hypothetical protein